MKTIYVRWDVTETHSAEIEVEDDFDPDDLGDLLAEHEDNESYDSTTERTIIEWEEVD